MGPVLIANPTTSSCWKTYWKTWDADYCFFAFFSSFISSSSAQVFQKYFHVQNVLPEAHIICTVHQWLPSFLTKVTQTHLLGICVPLWMAMLLDRVTVLGLPWWKFCPTPMPLPENGLFYQNFEEQCKWVHLLASTPYPSLCWLQDHLWHHSWLMWLFSLMSFLILLP